MSRTERNQSNTEQSAQTPGPSKGRKKRKRHPVAALLNGIGTLIMVLALALCLLLAVPRVAGIYSYVVISGSMEPAIPVGSLVYIRGCEPETLEAGDVILYYSTLGGDMPITHRVVENHPDQKELLTKGDANEQADLAPVAYINVKGKMLIHIPKVGYAAALLSSLMGKIGMAAVILAGYLLTAAADWIRKGR
ncbi:MAG: signal peptidase I [Mogibacterium sp.]|nr:signal peptidase I [Mogibacterium sp.]